MRRTLINRVTVLFVFSSLICTGCGCSDKDGTGKQDAGTDGSVDGFEGGMEASVEDAGPDTSVGDSGPGSDCTVSLLPHEEIVPGELYRLPPTGSSLRSLDWHEKYVAYSVLRCPPTDIRKSDVYLFDLETLEESVITEKPGSQYPLSIWGDGVVYEDLSYNDPETEGYEYRTEIIHFDIPTGQETRITDSNWMKHRVQYNGTHIAYLSWEWNPEDIDGPGDLVLRNMDTNQKTKLADHTQNIQRCHKISENYVTWQAVPVDEPGVWDIFYHHIPSGVTQRLNRSTQYLFCSDVSGEILAWNQAGGGSYNVFVRYLELGVEEQVTNNPYDQTFKDIRGHLIVWFDFRHSKISFPGYSYDVYLHDLETGVSRRLTNESRRWGVTKPSCKWVIYSEEYGNDQRKIFAWDMVVGGVLDENCRVIPCDPETEECAMIEWRGL